MRLTVMLVTDKFTGLQPAASFSALLFAVIKFFIGSKVVFYSICSDARAVNAHLRSA
jgi:hypothetical protein